MKSRHFVGAVCAAVAVAVATPVGSAIAQSFPSKPLRIVVGFPPGGGADFVARLVGAKLGEAFKQQVVIDNRAGANGIIASELVAKSPADGYTLLLGVSATHAINPNIYTKLPYDAVKDFAPISEVALTPLILVVAPSLPVNNVQDLIKLAKARPGEINFASAGNGNVTHLAAELFKGTTGINITHVPYKGSAPAIVDLMAGQVSMYFDTMPSSLPHVRAGKLKGLAVTSAKRSATAPDIPTVDESGVPGFETTSWFGLLAPAGTPPAVIDVLHRELAKALATPDSGERMKQQGLDPVVNNPAEFGNVIRTDIAKWGKVIKDANIRLQ
jgi:tripartite-type tricarboxylate transporter receptor subunit TctC